MPENNKAFNANTKYMTNGVAINPAIPSTGEEVKIIYDGLLAKNGAEHVLVHAGFGSSWEGTADYRMEKKKMGFEAVIPVTRGDTLNICFKDCAGNWDNNSGINYCFDVT